MWQYALCYYGGCLCPTVCRQKKKKKTYLAYCTSKQSFFGITFSGLLIFLVMSISSMWHVAPWGNRARGLAPTVRQTKCVCLCSSASLLCLCRDDRQKVHDCFTLSCSVYVCFGGFFFFFKTLDNLLLILMSFGDETGGLRLLLVTLHAVKRPKATHLEVLAEEKYNATLQCLQGRGRKTIFHWVCLLAH